jgi:hypothetical protein
MKNGDYWFVAFEFQATLGNIQKGSTIIKLDRDLDYEVLYGDIIEFLQDKYDKKGVYISAFNKIGSKDELEK